MSRAWTLIFRVIALAGALPLALTKHLPFADLPEHVAVIERDIAPIRAHRRAVQFETGG